MTQKLLLALALLLPACDADDPRGGQGVVPMCDGDKCDHNDEHEEDDEAEENVCWTSAPPRIDIDDAGICERLSAVHPALVDAAAGTDSTIFAPGNYPGGREGCWARVDNPGAAADLCATNDDVEECECTAGAANCWVQFDTASLLPALDDVLRDGRETEDACYFLGVAQRRCRGDLPQSSTTCDTASSCTPGLEIDCTTHAPPWIAGASFPAPQSRCTGVTVNGLGYANVVGHDLYGRDCQSPSTGAPTTCQVLGQTHTRMDPGLCTVLRECVEPAIACLRTDDDPTTYVFPSGTHRIAIDLVCGQTQTQGNHRIDLCRAVDINVAANGGNLVRDASWSDPEANLPPEFVAVMEECGLRWGGRFNTTYERMDAGCDPMHFDHCVPGRTPPNDLCE